MSTNGKEEYSSDEQFMKSEGFDAIDGGIEINGKICGEQLGDALLDDPDNCGICGETLTRPRMLHCLHVFCEHCLEKTLIGEGGDAGSPNTSIVCPTCNYETKVGLKKVGALPLDVIKTNVSDVSNTENPNCTSCTAKEVAKSCCNTCHNLLCNNCDTAHHYMRCFESHVVIDLEEMRKKGKKIMIHKPLDCEQHPGENIIYNCAGCNCLICAQCAKGDHKGHPTEAIADSEMRVRQDMESLLTKSKEKVDALLKCASDLENNLEELAHQRSAAKDLINETYQSYKAVLEKCKDEALEELNKLYHDRFLQMMKQSDDLGKTISNFEDACRYTSKLLDNGTVLEMIYLRQVVANRLLSLNTRVPKCDSFINLEFKSDFGQFEKVLKENFGTFLTETTLVVDSPQSPTNSSLNEIAPLAINGINKSPLCKPSPITNGGSPISLPTSMQSSFDGDLTNNIQNFTQLSSPTYPQVSATPALQGFSSIAEFNLAQLATLAETSSSAATSPTPSGFNFAELLSNDTAVKNLASLAKLGLNAGVESNSTITPNGANMLVRSTSSASLHQHLSNNNMINGFGGVSTSTSPLLSTPEDIMSTDGTLSSILPPSTTSSNPLPSRANKVSPMQIRCKFGQLGPSKSQFNSPHGFCLGLEEDIIVADTNNHRIQIFEKTGAFKFQFGIPGKDEGQLWYPRKVAVMRSTGKYVVCDRGNERSRMQIFTKNGHFLKKIAIRYIDIVAGLAVTTTGEIVAVDSVSPTVFIIHENGDLLRWFDCSDYMREPSDIAIHGKEYYVCDFKGHNVVVFNEDGQFLRRIGCENLTNFPNGIDISDAGDVLIGDSHGNRFHVAVFARDGSLITEFECPYVKVSRCCGLKITSEGYVVTLAKNNHHVLVLNTLYIL
ncbi:brain tumor protein-like isoform X2 [Anthonomus grandis grandis]|uniref:brain tumor protein-like isoform X2 n=1 Tax=Anthonomus grandis grandis TaxID=2921223 RepID=UPI0021654C6D|nr:brain tumor protein-like isoform X2 [Anthonomus grandis grandis]